MKEREAAQWLQELTHDVCWGIKVIDRKTGKSHPAYANTNKKLERSAAHRFTILRLLTHKLLVSHFSGEVTLYFTGSPDDYTLLMIDIDCHSRGSLMGALRFAEYLRENIFPGLYFEPSTNGNGVHGYLVVAKSDDKELNKAAKALDRWLKAVLSKTTFDVEDVEIKGTCSIWERGNVTEGTLAKYPRDVSRFDEWKRTTSLSVDAIRSLVATSSIRPMSTKEARRSGSIAGKHIDTEMIKNLLPFGRDLLGEEQISIGSKNRAVVTKEDVAVFATLLKFFTDNRNTDGSLPVARIRSLWKSLYECGDITRAWDHHRFMWLRNRFTTLELIDWEDSTYVVGDKEHGIVGQACKWHGSENFLNTIEAYTTSINNKDATASTIIREARGILGWSSLPREELAAPNNSVEAIEFAVIRPTRLFSMPWRWEDQMEKINRIVQDMMTRLELAA
jgi:hypothetical protein